MIDSMMLGTPRLILRPFAAADLDRLAELMANNDFMRFSLGPLTRKQTQERFLDKVIGWNPVSYTHLTLPTICSV